MEILQQIKRDADFIRKLIASLINNRATIKRNGVILSGEELENAIASAIVRNAEELKKLESILESGIIPDKYYSIITKQTYYPSEEDLCQQSESLPAAGYSFFCVKNSRKHSGLKYSSFKIIDDNGSDVIKFFMEHKKDKKYPQGGFGKVKKGSVKSSDFNPKYAVKIYHKDIFNGNTGHELRLAMRAAYCSQQLGRLGIAFRRNHKQYMVTEWLDGVNLNIAAQKQVQSMPMARRIVMAISLLRELNILHKQGLIFGDIKPGNVLINYGILNFVDLDSIRPKNEMPLDGATPMFTERFLPSAQMSFDASYNQGTLYSKFDENTDMYAMGLTLTYLFQDIYILKEVDRVINVDGGPIKTHTFKTFDLYHGPKYKEHPELQKILKNMVFQEQQELSTASDYIEALQSILSTYPDYETYLQEDRLKDLGSDLTSEDGVNAFNDIEIELLCFNSRLEAVSKLSL